MCKFYNNTKIKFHIGDVRDYESVVNAMIGVDFVFHAAALKQVPSCEFFPIQAVKTNVLGAENVLRAAIANQAKELSYFPQIRLCIQSMPWVSLKQ